MLETRFTDLSFRVLLRESGRRRDEMLDEVRERVAGFLAIGVIAAVPFYATLSNWQWSLVEVSEAEAAEPTGQIRTLEPPQVNVQAVLNRLGTNLLTRSDIRAAQSQLKLKGFDPGPLDGIAGRRTLAALNGYRKSLSLPQVLAVNRETLAPLQAQ